MSIPLIIHGQYQLISNYAGSLEVDLESGLSSLSEQELIDFIDERHISFLHLYSAGDVQNSAIELEWIGEAYNILGEHRNEVNILENALSLLLDNSDDLQKVRLLAKLINTHKLLGEYTQAFNYGIEAKELFEHSELDFDPSIIYNELGSIYLILGNYQTAIEYYSKAAESTLEAANHDAYQLSLVNLGIAILYQGDFERAKELLAEVSRQSADDGNLVAEAYSLFHLGIISHSQHNLEESRELYDSSLNISRIINDTALESSVLGSIGLLYENLGQHFTALNYYKEGLVIASQLENPELIGGFLNNIGHAFAESGDLEESEKVLYRAIEILDSIRPGLSDTYNVSIFDTQVSTFNLLVQVLASQENYEEALKVAEHGRARALFELLASREISEQTINPLVPPTYSELQSIAQQHNATIVEYVVIPDEDYNFLGRQYPPESQLYIWVMRPDGQLFFKQVELPKDSETTFRDLILRNHQRLGGGGLDGALAFLIDDPAVSSQALQELYRYLIDPINDLLPTDANEPVIFIPQGPLFLVPFAALQSPSGEYLIERHTILTAPAIHTLELTEQQQQRLSPNPQQDSLVVGNPSPMPSIPLATGLEPRQLISLPGAEQEATDIAALLNTEPLLNSRATKDAVLAKLPNSKIIHFATHGILRDFQDRDTPGSLALAKTDADDGLLSADEIQAMQLHAELAVLSACDTALGIVTGDGVVGLQRSLIAAGVPSVIVSQWAVPDAPTAFLITEFYLHWLQDKMNKAQALRQAMLKTKVQHPNPRDWAAFTLVGEYD